MASLMPLCAGLVGPKSENVEKPLVLQAFLKGQSGDGYFREELHPSRPDVFDVENARLGGHFAALGSSWPS